MVVVSQISFNGFYLTGADNLVKENTNFKDLGKDNAMCENSSISFKGFDQAWVVKNRAKKEWFMTEVNLELGGDKAVCVVLKYKSIYCHSMYHVFQNQKPFK